MATDTTSMSVKDLLGGAAAVPEFEIKLLPGWERHRGSDADKTQLDDRIKRRFMDLHRPDLYATVRSMIDESYDKMKQEGVLAFFAATGADEGKVVIPGSIVVSERRSAPGESLDTTIKALMRDFGAAPLFGDVRFMRYEREKTVTMQDATIAQTSLVYLTPIPGSGRKRALQFVASFGRPVEMSADDDKVKAWKFAFDSCISTLRWKV